MKNKHEYVKGQHDTIAMMLIAAWYLPDATTPTYRLDKTLWFMEHRDYGPICGVDVTIECAGVEAQYSSFIPYGTFDYQVALVDGTDTQRLDLVTSMLPLYADMSNTPDITADGLSVSPDDEDRLHMIMIHMLREVSASIMGEAAQLFQKIETASLADHAKLHDLCMQAERIDALAIEELARMHK